MRTARYIICVQLCNVSVMTRTHLDFLMFSSQIKLIEDRYSAPPREEQRTGAQAYRGKARQGGCRNESEILEEENPRTEGAISRGSCCSRRNGEAQEDE